MTINVALDWWLTDSWSRRHQGACGMPDTLVSGGRSCQFQIWGLLVSDRVNAPQRFFKFLNGVREEMKLVSWPTRDELVASALVVLVGVVLLATYISVCDFALSKTAHLLLR